MRPRPLRRAPPGGRWRAARRAARLPHRRGEGEVAGGDDADGASAGSRVDLGEIDRRAARAAHDDPRLDRSHRVRPDRGRRRVVDEDVDTGERVRHGRVHGDAQLAAAERLTEVAACGRSAHRRTQLEVRRVEDGGHERSAGPAGRSPDAHGYWPPRRRGELVEVSRFTNLPEAVLADDRASISECPEVASANVDAHAVGGGAADSPFRDLPVPARE